MTKFRGCIDIHAGQVKQIVGGTLTLDDADVGAAVGATENFVSTKPAEYYAQLYRAHNVEGCHVIKLGTNAANDAAARAACRAWPGALQVGGGITAANAPEWLDAGARQVIVTSWLFTNNALDWAKLQQILALVGPQRLVVDLSCRRVAAAPAAAPRWVVAINKWQTLTANELSAAFLHKVAPYCSEFLIHAADVEGLCGGIDEELVACLGQWCPAGFEGKLVYAGGARLAHDLQTVADLSGGKVDLTFGSALDIFGGDLVKFADVVAWNASTPI